MRVRILGSGTSSGVPRIGNDWGDCDPAEPRNRRSRASILVDTASTRILVDTTPDMREQLLAARVGDLDAVIWTHDHADHIHGIDDLRQLRPRGGGVVPGYARLASLNGLRRRFGYVFEGRGSYPATAAACKLPDTLAIGDLAIRCVDQPHGSITSALLRFDHGGKSMVYSTDFNQMTSDMKLLVKGVDLWIVDCLRQEPHPTHPNVAQVMEWIAELEPVRSVFTHMDLTMDYRQLRAMLPDDIMPGYDGMELFV